MDSKSISQAMREFARLAPVYDRRWASYVRTTHERTLRQLHLRPNQRLLDVGCGTGALLEMIAARWSAVELTGVDVCDKMLEVARQRLGQRAALVIARSERLPFVSERFDVVVSCSSLHYWQRPEDGLQEMARVLKPQGQMVITDWCRDYVVVRIMAFLLRIVRRASPQVLNCYGCEQSLQAVGCESISIERFKVGWLWGLLTATGRVPKRRPLSEKSRMLPLLTTTEGELLPIDSRGSSQPHGVSQLEQSL